MTAIALKQPPYFERVLSEGLAKGWLTRKDVERYSARAPNAIVQLATYFSTPHLRPALEEARVLLVHAVSLGLEQASESNPQFAATLMRSATIAKHSKAGFDLGRTLAQLEWLDDAGTKAYLHKLFSSPLSLQNYRSKKSQLGQDNDFLEQL